MVTRQNTSVDSRWPQLPEQRRELGGVPQVEPGDYWPNEGGVYGHPEPDAEAQELHKRRRLLYFQVTETILVVVVVRV